jgi:NAD-dependent SIR2 family protein deacetylase
VVWFNEQLDPAVLAAAEAATAACDLFITTGTSAVVYPAAGFAQQAKRLGAAVAEFNLDTTDATGLCDFAFQGRAGELLPAAFEVEAEVQKALQQLQPKQGHR